MTDPHLIRSLQVVNRDMSRRLVAAPRSSSGTQCNCAAGCDASLPPAALDDSLEELKPLFDAVKVAEKTTI